MTEDEEVTRMVAGLSNCPIIVMELDPFTAWCVVGNIQLALRHPGNTGPSADVARNVAERIIEAFPRSVRELARRGFDPQFDAEPETKATLREAGPAEGAAS